MEPRVGPFSTMKLSSPVRMVDTDHAGFHVSGWKSVMDRHNLGDSRAVRHRPPNKQTTPKDLSERRRPHLVLHLKRPLGVIM